MAGPARERRQAVLRAIVADYIAMQEPVGSKTLVEKHKLQVSSATIRNDMAVLETEGYIAQPHASSGRVPTEKGYRAFVDAINDVKPLSLPERRAISDFLESGVDLEDVMRRSAHLLAQLTRQAAVVQLPTLSVSRIKHCEVVALTPRRLLLVVITDNGRVDQRNVELSSPIDESGVTYLRDLLNGALAGKTMSDASTSLALLAADPPPAVADHLTRAIAVIMGNVSVVIGKENEDEDLAKASIVTTSYGTAGETFGGLGVLGPTYMDYPGTIQKVAAVANYISLILAGEERT